MTEATTENTTTTDFGPIAVKIEEWANAHLPTNSRAVITEMARNLADGEVGDAEPIAFARLIRSNVKVMNKPVWDEHKDTFPSISSGTRAPKYPELHSEFVQNCDTAKAAAIDHFLACPRYARKSTNTKNTKGLNAEQYGQYVWEAYYREQVAAETARRKEDA